MRLRFAVLAIVYVLLGCGHSTPPPPTVDAYFSLCGHPGDTGNELGIGKFCMELSDCTVSTAPLCSDLGDANTHFCTTTCSMTGSGGQCGTAAMCVCNSSNQCGCTPNACLTGSGT